MSEAAQAMPASLYLPALFIAVSLLGSAVLIIGFFVRYWMNSQEKKDAEQDSAIEKVRQDLSDFKAQVPRQYTQKDDFIRVSAGLDMKVDKISSEIVEINKNLSKLIGGSDRDRC